MKFASLIFAVVLSVATSASADYNLSVFVDTALAETVSLTYQGNTELVYAGKTTGQLDNGPAFPILCVDITKNIAPVDSYAVNPTALLTQSQQFAANLLTIPISGTTASYAALQVAAWNFIYGSSLTVTGLSSEASSLVPQYEGYALTSSNANGTLIVPTGYGQPFVAVVAVPEPTSVLLLLIGVAALPFLRG